MDSSPVRASASPPAEVLTPRSKVAKMLADIDNAPTPSPVKDAMIPEGVQDSNFKDNDAHSPHDERFVLPAGATDSAIGLLSGAVSAGPFEFGSETESDDAVRWPQRRAARRRIDFANTNAPETDVYSTLQSASSPPHQPGNDDGQAAEDDLYYATPMQLVPNPRELSGSPLGSARSEKLFVSPAKSVGNDSDEELPANPLGSKERLAEIVTSKRAERLARQKEEAKKRKSSSSAEDLSDLPEEGLENSGETPNPDIERIMSDAARPSRRASKKALLEMERETQRLARQQALAHQMKTKKKFTTSDLLARFNFRQPDQPQGDAGEDTTASSAPNSDGTEVSAREPASTPPSSPPSVRPTPLEKQTAIVEQGALSKLMLIPQDSLASLATLDDDAEDLPEIQDILRPTQKAVSVVVDIPSANKDQEKKGLKLARLGKKAGFAQDSESSDDDLDIIQPMPHHLRAFDSVKASTNIKGAHFSRAIYTLKHLSHIGVHEPCLQKKGTRPSIAPNTLEAQLRKRAREQARQEQLERIAELKAKGVEIQTVEERDREAEVFENLLEKARQDAVGLRKAEKAALLSKKGEVVAAQVSDDEDEDEDYIASGSEEEEGGGEEEEEEEEEENDGDEKEGDSEDLVDDAPEYTDEGKDESKEDEPAEAEQLTKSPQPAGDEESNSDAQDIMQELSPVGSRKGYRKSRQSRIVRDEDDDGELAAKDFDTSTAIVSDDPFAAFNFAANGSNVSLLSPTQAFQATMQTPTQATQEDSLDILRRIAPPSASSLPLILPAEAEDTQTQEESQAGVVPGSQVPESQRINLAWESQPPETPVPGISRSLSALSETSGWEPTQDPGLPSPWTVDFHRRIPTDEKHETQSTVRLRISESPAPSIAPMRRGRLLRRQVAAVDSDEEDRVPPASLKRARVDAFREMARRRKEALTATEREEAEKEIEHMMDEQAEESEDEYAGLGGDDYVAPETEADKEMIDSSHIEVDERALAAHFAERERIRQEEETNKLYKDLTTGALRKNQANVFDLDEDEDEVAMRRRQMRQREEARKRKLLLQDDNIAGLAEGKPSKGKDAFLKAIADDDDGADILDLSDADRDEDSTATRDDSQPPQQAVVPGPLTETSGNKRRFTEDEEVPETSLPAKQRRTQSSAFRRPSSMLEVKESVSFLLDEPSTAVFRVTAMETVSDNEVGTDSEQSDSDNVLAEDENLECIEKARQNDGGFAPNTAAFDAHAMPPPRLPASQRRTAPKPTVVDRLSLKRGSSNSDSTLGRTAWAAGLAAGAFKAPSLLRRATTSIASTGNERGVTTPSLSREGSGAGVKMGGTRKSSLAYQARAEERKAIVEASAKRRAENTAKIAQMRRNSSMLGRGLTGRFE